MTELTRRKRTFALTWLISAVSVGALCMGVTRCTQESFDYMTLADYPPAWGWPLAVTGVALVVVALVGLQGWLQFCGLPKEGSWVWYISSGRRVEAQVEAVDACRSGRYYVWVRPLEGFELSDLLSCKDPSDLYPLKGPL